MPFEVPLGNRLDSANKPICLRLVLDSSHLSASGRGSPRPDSFISAKSWGRESRPTGIFLEGAPTTLHWLFYTVQSRWPRALQKRSWAPDARPRLCTIWQRRRHPRAGRREISPDGGTKPAKCGQEASFMQLTSFIEEGADVM